MTFPDPVEHQQLIGEFNAARDAEYAEVLERLPAFRQELDLERARGRVTYAEVEESEADLERFRSWLAKIGARDYFAAPPDPPRTPRSRTPPPTWPPSSRQPLPARHPSLA